MPLRSHENILIFYKRQPIYNKQITKSINTLNFAIQSSNSEVYRKHNIKESQTGTTDRNPKSYIEMSVVNNDSMDRIHPNQKPVALMEYLIKTYTNDGYLVLDNCCGSGTTGVACHNLDRHFIGIEKDKKYFELAVKRIKEHKRQQKLF